VSEEFEEEGIVPAGSFWGAFMTVNAIQFPQSVLSLVASKIFLKL
jgi:hypothetical protein